jgi:serine/threonine protein kinase
MLPVTISIDEAYQLLVQLGRRPLIHIGSGMEGHVFDIGDERVAKVWFSKTLEELLHLQAFCKIVSDLKLPFETSLITDVHETPNTSISIERALHGTPLNDVMERDANLPQRFAADAIISVLTALRDHPVQDVTSVSPMFLGSVSSSTAGLNETGATVLEVAQGKVERYGDQLRRSVRDFDWVYAQTAQQVRQYVDGKLHVVHGDICPPNILLDSDLNVSAVIDWGLLSHFGDTALDASIACGSFNLYGDHYRENDAYLVAECVDRHGYDLQRLLVYRALYAILTSNAFSEDGTDGHYAWCVENLNRDDVRAALADGRS